MSDVKVPYGKKAGDTATLLLAAAEELEMDASVVRTNSIESAFVVPEEVAKKAGVDTVDESDEGDEPTEQADEGDEKPKAAKKSTAKKAANKRSGS